MHEQHNARTCQLTVSPIINYFITNLVFSWKIRSFSFLVLIYTSYQLPIHQYVCHHIRQ